MSKTRYEAIGPRLEFQHLGLPAPQGSIRSLGAGRPSVHGNADKLKPWRVGIQTAAEESIEKARLARHSIACPFQGPMGMGIWFTMRKPVSAPKTKTTYPIARPDIDKLARAVLDASQAAGLFFDDSQVIWMEVKKVYPNEDIHALHVPGVFVEAFEVQSVLTLLERRARP